MLLNLVIAVFLENNKNDSKLKYWINFGIYWKNLLSHSWPWPWPWVCGLGLACLWPWPWLSGLGLDTSGLVNIPVRDRIRLHASVCARSVVSKCRMWRMACAWKLHDCAAAETCLLNIRRWSSTTPSTFISLTGRSTPATDTYDMDITACSWLFVPTISASDLLILILLILY